MPWLPPRVLGRWPCRSYPARAPAPRVRAGAVDLPSVSPSLSAMSPASRSLRRGSRMRSCGTPSLDARASGAARCVPDDDHRGRWRPLATSPNKGQSGGTEERLALAAAKGERRPDRDPRPRLPGRGGAPGLRAREGGRAVPPLRGRRGLAPPEDHDRGAHLDSPRTVRERRGGGPWTRFPRWSTTGT